MPNEISIFPGRLKTFAAQWRQGSPTGPALNTTGATFAVLRNTLSADPVIAAVDETQGQYTITFPSAATQGRKQGSFFTVVVALTLAGGAAGYSPDPLTITGVIQ